MLLYELPTTDIGTKLYLNKNMHVGVEGREKKDVYAIFWHVDGMYSYCTLHDEHTNEKLGVLHLSASTPVRHYKDGYKISEE